jgi:hypothetical protein
MIYSILFWHEGRPKGFSFRPKESGAVGVWALFDVMARVSTLYPDVWIAGYMGAADGSSLFKVVHENGPKPRL